MTNIKPETEESYIDVNGTSIYVQRINFPKLEASERPTLVFLHDGLGSIGQWQDFPLQIARAVCCPTLIYDRPGYGRSSASGSTKDTQYLHREAIEVLPDVLEKCGIKNKIVPIGHSDGGSIAVIFAGSFPGRVAGMVVEAAHLFVEDITLEGLNRTLDYYTNRNLKEKLMRYHGDKTDDVFNSWCNIWLSEEFRNWNIEEFLPNISCPVLAMQGFDDEYGTKAQLQSIVRNVRGKVKTVMLPNCRHIPHRHALDRAKSEIINFLEDNIIAK